MVSRNMRRCQKKLIVKNDSSNYGKHNFTASDWLRFLFSLIFSYSHYIFLILTNFRLEKVDLKKKSLNASVLNFYLSVICPPLSSRVARAMHDISHEFAMNAAAVAAAAHSARDEYLTLRVSLRPFEFHVGLETKHERSSYKGTN
jgi:hypothetical protein